MDLGIERVAAVTPEVQGLIAELDEVLDAAYEPYQQHGLALEQLFAPDMRFFLARRGGVAVGCGGVAFLDGYGEVKRMYVRPSARGRGVAKALLRRIEDECRDAGFNVLRLETGTDQHQALGLYARVGFLSRGPFGPYAAMPSERIEKSLFFEKRLVVAR